VPPSAALQFAFDMAGERFHGPSFFSLQHHKGDSVVALIEKMIVGFSYIFSRFLHVLIV
jgi:hypothetical protein